MSTKSNVLKCLINASPNFISGEEIADTLSLSRQAVWKAVSTLKLEGYHIESVTKKGYKYTETDILSVEGISSYLPSSLKKLQLIVRDEVDSTNRKLKELAHDKKLQDTVLAVTKQSSGTGRFGRPFYSDGISGGLYFSLLLHPDTLFSDMANYTIIAAVAVVSALELLTKKSLQIKWVNDIYLDGKKVCGILTEAVTDIESRTISEVVIGIGLNVSIPTEQFPKEIQSRVTSLYPSGNSPVTRNEILAKILMEFYRLLELDNSEVISMYSEKSLVIGHSISFKKSGSEIEGVAKSIGPHGELVVETSDGIISLNSGEISLKRF